MSSASTPLLRHSSVFSCSISRANGRVGIGIIGEIDRTSAGQFRNQLLTLAKEHPVAIAIDMKQSRCPTRPPWRCSSRPGASPRSTASSSR